MSRTPEETEAYLQDVIQQRDALLDRINQIHLAADNEDMFSVKAICRMVWLDFNRPELVTLTETLDLKVEPVNPGPYVEPSDTGLHNDLTKEAPTYIAQSQELIVAELTLGDILTIATKELTIDDIFGTKDKYYIMKYVLLYSIKDQSGGDILRFYKRDNKAERKAKLALKLLNNSEPDDIGLLIEMLTT